MYIARGRPLICTVSTLRLLGLVSRRWVGLGEGRVKGRKLKGALLGKEGERVWLGEEGGREGGRVGRRKEGRKEGRGRQREREVGGGGGGEKGREREREGGGERKDSGDEGITTNTGVQKGKS